MSKKMILGSTQRAKILLYYCHGRRKWTFDAQRRNRAADFLVFSLHDARRHQNASTPNFNNIEAVSSPLTASTKASGLFFHPFTYNPRGFICVNLQERRRADVQKTFKTQPT